MGDVATQLHLKPSNTGNQIFNNFLLLPPEVAQLSIAELQVLRVQVVHVHRIVQHHRVGGLHIPEQGGLVSHTCIILSMQKSHYILKLDFANLISCTI